MKWLKICFLFVLTLATMRATSWVLAWGLVRLAAANLRIVAVAANLAGFAAFLALLYVNTLPGEPVDWAAILFGLLVFAIYTVTDFFWRPWARRVRPQSDV